MITANERKAEEGTMARKLLKNSAYRKSTSTPSAEVETEAPKKRDFLDVPRSAASKQKRKPGSNVKTSAAYPFASMRVQKPVTGKSQEMIPANHPNRLSQHLKRKSISSSVSRPAQVAPPRRVGRAKAKPVRPSCFSKEDPAMRKRPRLISSDEEEVSGSDMEADADELLYEEARSRKIGRYEDLMEEGEGV